jgi:MFS family permease
VLLVGEILDGLILGTYATIAPAYASEVCPIALRGVLTAYINLCLVMGQLLANDMLAGTSQLSTHWAYSAPFAIQWLWPLIILIGVFFAPESPWWLVRKGRIEDAENALIRLASSTVDVKPTLAMSRQTVLSTRWRWEPLTWIASKRPTAAGLKLLLVSTRSKSSVASIWLDMPLIPSNVSLVDPQLTALAD